MSQKQNGWIAVISVMALLLASGLPCPAAGGTAADDAAGGSGTITGEIEGVGGKGKADRAVVHAYHIESGKVISSEPAGANGGFTLTGVPTGYLDLAVEYRGEIYIANQVIHMPPSGKMVLRFSLAEFGQQPEEDALGGRESRFPGTDKKASGYASIKKKLRGREFWRSPKGIAIITAGGGLVLLGIAVGGESDASPFTTSGD